MSMADTSENDQVTQKERVSFVDLGMALYERLTGRGAAINYEFKEMLVEVPRDTGPDAPRATWKLNGVLRITTDEPGSPNRPD
jgi:hypothetical protein